MKTIMMMMNIKIKTTNNGYDGSDDDKYHVIDNNKLQMLTIFMMENGEQES